MAEQTGEWNNCNSVDTENHARRQMCKTYCFVRITNFEGTNRGSDDIRTANPTGTKMSSTLTMLENRIARIVSQKLVKAFLEVSSAGRSRRPSRRSFPASAAWVLGGVPVRGEGPWAFALAQVRMRSGRILSTSVCGCVVCVSVLCLFAERAPRTLLGPTDGCPSALATDPDRPFSSEDCDQGIGKERACNWDCSKPSCNGTCYVRTTFPRRRTGFFALLPTEVSS